MFPFDLPSANHVPHHFGTPSTQLTRLGQFYVSQPTHISLSCILSLHVVPIRIISDELQRSHMNIAIYTADMFRPLSRLNARAGPGQMIKEKLRRIRERW